MKYQKQERRVSFLHVPKQQHLLMLAMAWICFSLTTWAEDGLKTWLSSCTFLTYSLLCYSGARNKITCNPNFFQRRNPEYVLNLPSSELVFRDIILSSCLWVSLVPFRDVPSVCIFKLGDLCAPLKADRNKRTGTQTSASPAASLQFNQSKVPRVTGKSTKILYGKCRNVETNSLTVNCSTGMTSSQTSSPQLCSALLPCPVMPNLSSQVQLATTASSASSCSPNNHAASKRQLVISHSHWSSITEACTGRHRKPPWCNGFTKPTKTFSVITADPAHPLQSSHVVFQSLLTHTLTPALQNPC